MAKDAHTRSKRKAEDMKQLAEAAGQPPLKKWKLEGTDVGRNQVTINGQLPDAANPQFANPPRHDEIENGRLPRTVVSATWRDGEKAPLFICLGTNNVKGQAGPKIIDDFNTKYQGEAKAVCTGKRNHFFDGDMTMQYLEDVVGPPAKMHVFAEVSC